MHHNHLTKYQYKHSATNNLSYISHHHIFSTPTTPANKRIHKCFCKQQNYIESNNQLTTYIHVHIVIRIKWQYFLTSIHNLNTWRSFLFDIVSMHLQNCVIEITSHNFHSEFFESIESIKLWINIITQCVWKQTDC